MGHGLALLLVHPLQQRFGVDDGTRRAVTVIRVTSGARTGRAAREGALEEVVGDLLAGAVVLGVLGRRRGRVVLRAAGVEGREEAVVEEAAHRRPSLGRPTDSPHATVETHTVHRRTPGFAHRGPHTGFSHPDRPADKHAKITER